MGVAGAASGVAVSLWALWALWALWVMWAWEPMSRWARAFARSAKLLMPVPAKALAWEQLSVRR